MINNCTFSAVSKTLLFSGTNGVLGFTATAIGSFICDTSIWDDIGIVQLMVEGGVGNALLALPTGACYALSRCNAQNNLDDAINSNLITSLKWISGTAGLGSLAGASILGFVHNNAQGISATSLGMVGGLTLGICALSIKGVHYAIMACRNGELSLGRVVIENNESPMQGSPRVPLLHDIEAINPEEIIPRTPFPSLDEISDIIETKLNIPVETFKIDDLDEKEKETESNGLIDVDLQDTLTANSVSELTSKSRRCSIM